MDENPLVTSCFKMTTCLFWSIYKKNGGNSVVQSFDKRVNEILNLITTNPEIFVPSQKQKNIRRCVITRHVSLYYRPGKENIELVAFIDNRSNPKNTNF